MLGNGVGNVGSTWEIVTIMVGHEQVERSTLSRSTGIPSDLTAGPVEAASPGTGAVMDCSAADWIVPT